MEIKQTAVRWPRDVTFPAQIIFGFHLKVHFLFPPEISFLVSGRNLNFGFRLKFEF